MHWASGTTPMGFRQVEQRFQGEGDRRICAVWKMTSRASLMDGSPKVF